MKLYTEEQVRQIASTIYLGHFDCNDTPDDLVNELTPIELPSDEEIDNCADFAFPDAEKIGKETYSAYKGMKIGAKWAIEQIKKQDG